MRMIPFFAMLIAAFMASCSPRETAKPSEFPMEKGTTWVYSYVAYHQAAAPDQILEATYRLTESVVDVEWTLTYFIAHVKKDYELGEADIDWPDGEFTDDQLETWYLRNESQIFESHLPVDTNNIQAEFFLLAYDLPISLGKSWCWPQVDLKSPDDKQIANCEFVGKRTVTNEGSFQTPAGRFEACYELTDYFNNGNIIHWFCEGVGVVFRKFDHAGTRFGFEQTLLSHSVGAP
jgi:hypothetical protein